jgi:hypothetical protein
MKRNPDYYREIGRRGGKVRAAQFTPEYQAWARSHVSAESCAKNGHRGAVATARKHGYHVTYRLAREWRLANPSSHEQAVIGILADLGQVEGRDYEREFEPLGEGAKGHYCCVDFAWPDRKLALEVNGKVHYDPMFDHPNAPRTRATNEARRLDRLDKAGWRVLMIDYRELDDLDHVRRMIAAFLEVCNGC